MEYNQVPYLLYQYGFGKVGPVSNTNFDQDGSYSVLLFDGEYKMIIPGGAGAFPLEKYAGRQFRHYCREHERQPDPQHRSNALPT